MTFVSVNNPGHFLLCWEFEPPPTESGRGKLVYIDCFKRGQRGEGNANRIVPSPQQVFQRMVNNLLHGFEVNISSESNRFAQLVTIFPFQTVVCLFDLVVIPESFIDWADVS